MQASGFVLAGGQSSRMGRDKALLPYRGTTLVEYVAGTVREALGSVALIGDPAKLGQFGIAVIADEIPGRGPVGGIYTALRTSQTDWNLILACDMPNVPLPLLRDLVRAAETAACDCIAATGPDGQPEPLCAVYHRRCLPVLTRAIQGSRLKMRDLLNEIGWMGVAVASAALANVNTPEEWSEFEAAR